MYAQIVNIKTTDKSNCVENHGLTRKRMSDSDFSRMRAVVAHDFYSPCSFLM